MNKRTGALIVAAGGRPEENKFRPLEQVGDSTVIRRIIITMKQAGIEPIVVVTGHQGDELEKHVAKLQVIFLRNKDYQKTQMFDSSLYGAFLYAGALQPDFRSASQISHVSSADSSSHDGGGCPCGLSRIPWKGRTTRF